METRPYILLAFAAILFFTLKLVNRKQYKTVFGKAMKKCRMQHFCEKGDGMQDQPPPPTDHAWGKVMDLQDSEKCT